MYTVLLNNSTILHDPWPGSRIKAVGRIRKAVNSIDALDLTLYPGNPGYDSLVPLLSKIYVYNDDGDPVFIGRVLKPTGTMESTGEIKRSFVCEGELGYLCDTVQKYRTVGTTYYFFEKVLEQHNSQVTSGKQISLGTVTVSKGYHQRTWGYTTSFKAITDYISDYGGEIRLRYDENGNRFLDYTDTAFSSASTTPIELAVNMISASYTVDPTKIASGIFAAGKKLNDDGTTAERLELDDVIWDNTLVSLYGKVVACETWDDVTTKAALEDKAEAWLDGQTAEITQYTITAAQMYELSYNFDNFEVGMTYPVINPLIGLDDTVRCVSMDIDINDPTKTTMTFGDRYTTIAQAIASTSNRSQQIAKLDSSVLSMNSSIGNLKQSTGELATQVSGLSGDVSSLSSSVSSINTRLTAAEEAISHISTDVIYSTDERKIGSWIDGDDLYEKTVVIPALGDGMTRSVQAAHGIENLGEVVESRGMLLDSGAFRPLQAIPIGSDGASVIPESGTSYSVGRTSITVTCGTDDMSSCKAYVTMRYTKSNETHTDIEYIRSTGTQFIDTDIYMNIATQRIELDCMFSNYEVSANDEAFCGGALDTAQSANRKKISIWTSYDRFSNYNFGVLCPYLVMDEIRSLSDYSTRGVASLQPNGNCGWNNSFTATGTYQASSSVPIRVFGYKGESSADDTILSHVNMTLYSVKIIDLSSGSLLHNLTPARRDQDGAVGLYDNITGKFYGNAGTDPFIVPT